MTNGNNRDQEPGLDAGGVTEAGQDEPLLNALRRGYPSARFDGAAIEARIDETIAGSAPGRFGVETHRSERIWTTTARGLLAAAAALAVFIAGIEYGRRSVAPVQAEPPAVEADLMSSLPLTIQSAGSRYIASLARLGSEEAQLSPEQRRVAREVALSALLGAALELMREDGTEDETLRAAAALISEKREGLALGAPASGNSFE